MFSFNWPTRKNRHPYRSMKSQKNWLRDLTCRFYSFFFRLIREKNEITEKSFVCDCHAEFGMVMPMHEKQCQTSTPASRVEENFFTCRQLSILQWYTHVSYASDIQSRFSQVRSSVCQVVLHVLHIPSFFVAENYWLKLNLCLQHPFCLQSAR